MTIIKNDLIGDVVAKNYLTAAVFKRFAIDFCCNGNRTIETACNEAGITQDVLIKQLETIINDEEIQGNNYRSWPLDLLANYVQSIHHSYVEKKIAEIRPYLELIRNVHGDKHPELHEISRLFNESANELSSHMKKEEMVLFPWIKKIAGMSKTDSVLAGPPSGKLEKAVAMMNEEHDHEGERFRKIALLSGNYALPADGCNSYRVAMELLRDFEDDLHLHIHIENNILFPKAIELEQSLSNN